MLPHLAERPLNLQRFPNGAAAPGFWQKDIPATAPTWLTRWHETEVDGREDRDANDHLIADRAATLCWLGNQASFEIHAWTGRLPEAVAADLRATSTSTRATKTTWEETLILARLYRTALGHLGVRGYPEDDRQARHPGLDPGRAEVHVRRDERLGREGLAGGRRRPCPTSSRGSGRRVPARAAPVSTTPRTRASRRSSRRTRSGRRPARRCPRRSPGTSWTTRRSGRTAGRSGRSSSGWRRSATCSPTPRPTRRSSRAV